MEDLKQTEDLATSVMQPHLLEQERTTRRLATVALRRARILLILALAIAALAVYLVTSNPRPVNATNALLIAVSAMNLLLLLSRYRSAKQSANLVNGPAA